jgi:hypothetical protein
LSHGFGYLRIHANAMVFVSEDMAATGLNIKPLVNEKQKTCRGRAENK